MNTNLQNLLFKVSLLDKMSGPAKGMMKTMDTVTNRIQSGYRKIGYGIAGVVGAGYGLNRLIGPSKEMAAAISEVRSLDVGNDVLAQLTQNALKFSTQYGESAIEFVSASYDIQSAIAGLSGKELPAFTTASAILAKGTKADTATITGYVGTMYGIFQKNADEMGKANWVNMLAGQTATAVQMFKTTGAEMSGAFGNLGAEAQSHGVAMNEQIAILGTLQATMTGVEAGTKYKSFLAGVGKAQKTLGLVFTDTNGKMLPMVTILERIKGKYGEIDTVAESDLLQKAFGRKEAVGLIKLLSTNVDGLNSSIAQIGEQTGIDKAIQMANTMVEPWDKAGKTVEAIQIKFGGKLLEVLQPAFEWFTKTGQTMLRWMEMFPNLTKWVGIGVLGIAGLIAGFSLLSIVAGLSSFVMGGWVLGAKLLGGALWLLKGAIFTVIPAVWGFTTALLANPITWVVLGIAALTAGVIAAIIYWDEWTGAVVDFMSQWWELIGVFAVVDGVIAIWDKLPEWWKGFKNWLSELDLFAFIGSSIDWLLEKLNFIPGINIDFADAPKPPKAPAAIAGNASGSTPQGGLMNQISNVMTSSKSQDVGGITVKNYGSPMNGFQLADELGMAAG